MTTLTVILIIVSTLGSVVNAMAATTPPTSVFGKVLHVVAALLPLDFQRTVAVLQTPAPSATTPPGSTLH